MKQYTYTYRITISAKMKQKLDILKKYNIMPTSFIRRAIDEKFERDFPEIVKKEHFTYPF